MATKTHVFQAPKGTRDFYPAEMAVRRHLEDIWRSVSVNHGFDEIDGPTFEHLDLYTVKSGEEIVSELFSFERQGGDTTYALRPEFTPTLARMYAANANSLPKPTKWFSVPSHFRAERPQRGRLREFYQWNIDIIGDDSARADAEVIGCTVGVLERLGLASADMTIKLSHRAIVTDALAQAGVGPKDMSAAMVLLDRRAKLSSAEFAERANAIDLDDDALRALLAEREAALNGLITAWEQGAAPPVPQDDDLLAAAHELTRHLDTMDVLRWCAFDLSIVRGLAYYTGSVFEVHEASGRERAVAGGGRYDGLIELFGGPPTPAVGIAMGDVVIRLVLEDRGLLRAAEEYLPRPDVFVISTRDETDAHLSRIVADLRRQGYHARHSSRSTRNVGKLLGEAGKLRSRLAVILGQELDQGHVIVKELDTGQQHQVGESDLAETICTALESGAE